MGYFSQSVAVPSEWEDVFAPLYFARNDGPEPVSHRLLPNLRTLLVFSLGTPASLAWQGEELVVSGSIVVGPLREALSYTLPAGSDIVVVNFRFDAFTAFSALHFTPGYRGSSPKRWAIVLPDCGKTFSRYLPRKNGRIIFSPFRRPISGSGNLLPRG